MLGAGLPEVLVELRPILLHGAGDLDKEPEQAEAQQQSHGEMKTEILFRGQAAGDEASQMMPDHASRPRETWFRS